MKKMFCSIALLSLAFNVFADIDRAYVAQHCRVNIEITKEKCLKLYQPEKLELIQTVKAYLGQRGYRQGDKSSPYLLRVELKSGDCSNDSFIPHEEVEARSRFGLVNRDLPAMDGGEAIGSAYGLTKKSAALDAADDAILSALYSMNINRCIVGVHYTERK